VQVSPGKEGKEGKEGKSAAAGSKTGKEGSKVGWVWLQRGNCISVVCRGRASEG